MKSKLNLDQSLIDRARSSAKNIADNIQKFIDEHTTVTVERSILRLFGVDGTDEIGTPLPNIVIDNIKKAGGLSTGITYFMANAILNTGLSPQEIAEKIASEDLDITKLPSKPEAEII
ncbi:MAG: D-lysine 5,6-aminomutase subunit alpha, partial [Clostridiales bacterium]|nr:D-lysine 5,6-aminomutase subunit alpha [Clostridiales bacterium]